jgi:hypothetical protein
MPPGQPVTSEPIRASRQIASVEPPCRRNGGVRLLPVRASIAYQGTLEALAEETSWFILRGIGVKDTAIMTALSACSENPLELSAD